MLEINPTNIPAFQRIKNIKAQEKKQKNNFKPTISTTRKTRNKKTEELFIPLQESQTQIFSKTNNISINNDKNTDTSEVTEMKICGTCEGFFDKINVAIIKVTSPIRNKDTLIFETTEGLFQQTLNSIQINRKNISLARSGNKIGVKVLKTPKLGGLVYKIIK